MTVLFRADAAPQIGTGHVMRCLALAEALIEAGVRCLFAMAQSNDGLDRRIEAAGAERRTIAAIPGSRDDFEATRGLLAAEGCRALVIDGYRFDSAYRAGLRASGVRVLAFDDLGDLPALHADVVVNAAPTATGLSYDRIAPGAVHLLGADYVALRREIRVAAAERRPLPERRAILLTFGGSDPLGLTAPCIERLAPALDGQDRLIVAVGVANPQVDVIREAARRHGGRVELHVNSTGMGALMAQAGLAVSAAGTTVGELAALAVPTILVVSADNQAPAAGPLSGTGWCRVVDGRLPDAVPLLCDLALQLWRDPGERQRMQCRVSGTVDTDGVHRILQALLEGMPPLHLQSNSGCGSPPGS
jgi:UDP-2,4-diacetamido-2,4,6-trideoxy-beta-L-altropyranose hydrolase